MDFYRILSTQLAEAGHDERVAFYGEMRAGVVLILKRNAVAEGTEAHRAFLDKFETAVRKYETERTLAVMTPEVEMAGARDSARTVSEASDGVGPGRGETPLSKWRALGFVLLGVAVGAACYAIQEKMLRSRGAPLVASFDQRLPTYAANLAYLQRVRSAIEARRSQTGSFPQTPATFLPLATVAAAVPALLGLISHPFEEGATVLYRSDGRDYKLVAYRSGDCFMARILDPPLVDPVRSAGSVDCIYHGYWTPGGAEW